ncbi:MAG: orotate phosphoribosyltransferase [Spirochaetaceae bacterium]
MNRDFGKELAKTGLELGSIRLSPGHPFLWASGYYMPIYNDNRMLLGTPELRRLVAEGFASLLRGREIEAEVIAGTATAGIPHATTLSDLLGLPLTYVRNKPKEHGLQNQIEGLNADGGYGGRRVILIEDLISTGGSSINAVEAIRRAGGVVDYCLSIFDYGLEESKRNFAALSPQCRPLSVLTYDTLLETAREEGYITIREEESLIKWRRDPFGWQEKMGFAALDRENAGAVS